MRLSNATGRTTFKEEASGKVTFNQFDTKDVFVYDSGAQVFVWVGKGATAEEKRMGLQYAQSYLGAHSRPAWLPISRIVEGGESETFIQSLDDLGKAFVSVAA